MRWGGLLLCVLLGACREGYAASDLELVTAYRAKELCSCLFVTGQSEDFCLSYTSEEPDVARPRIDWETKTVSTAAFLLWGAKARFESPRTGCILD